MVYYARLPLRILIPTVTVHLRTDDGDLSIRARWRSSPLQLQRQILHRMRNGRLLWFEDEGGHPVCIRPESVSAARVDGR